MLFSASFFVEHLLGFPGHMIFSLGGSLGLTFLSGVMQHYLNWGGACYGEQNRHPCICICMQNNSCIIVRKVDHDSFLPAFWTSQLQGNMIMYPCILVFLLSTCPMLDFNFPRATVKMLLYAFSKVFSCGEFC